LADKDQTALRLGVEPVSRSHIRRLFNQVITAQAHPTEASMKPFQALKQEMNDWVAAKLLEDAEVITSQAQYDNL
jgi:hypothetical protein